MARSKISITQTVRGKCKKIEFFDNETGAGGLITICPVFWRGKEQITRVDIHNCDDKVRVVNGCKKLSK